MDRNWFAGKLKINSCGMTHCTAEWSWDTREVPFRDCDLWCVLEGHGGLLAPGEDVAVRAGDCCFLRPGLRYVGRQDARARLTVLHIHFDFLDEAGAPRRLPDGAYPRLWRSVEDFPFFHELLMRTLLFFGRGDEETAAHWLRAALIELAEQDRVRTADSVNGRWKSLLGPLCAQIQEYPERSWGLAPAAREFGYSSDYFGRVFRKFTGQPFGTYVIRARVNKAKMLLRSSGYTVQQIADQLGYKDVGFFCRQFRQWVNAAPREYRK